MEITTWDENCDRLRFKIWDDGCGHGIWGATLSSNTKASRFLCLTSPSLVPIIRVMFDPVIARITGRTSDITWRFDETENSTSIIEWDTPAGSRDGKYLPKLVGQVHVLLQRQGIGAILRVELHARRKYGWASQLKMKLLMGILWSRSKDAPSVLHFSGGARVGSHCEG